MSDIALGGIAGLLAAVLASALGFVGLLVGVIVVISKRRGEDAVPWGTLFPRFLLGPIMCCLAGATGLMGSWNSASDKADTQGVVSFVTGLGLWVGALLIAHFRR